MQFQRIMLFAALGLVLVMIWQSWVEFQSTYVDGTVTPTTAENGGQSNLTEDVPEAPEVTVDTETGDAPLSDETVPDVEESDGKGQLISVVTDLVRAEIDTHGGDLVRLELLAHPVSVDTPDVPFVQLFRNSSGLFVAQNGLIGKDREYPNHNVQYTSSKTNYELDDQDNLEVILKWSAPDGVAYEKVYRFTRNSYRIAVDFRIANNSESAWTGFAYGQLKQTEIEAAGSMGILGRLPSYNGAAIYTVDNKYEKIDYGEIREEDLNVTTPEGWVAMLQHYFVAAWLPTGSDNYQFYSGVSRNTAKPQYRIGYKTTQPVVIEPGDDGVIETAMFVGPKEQHRLDAHAT